MGGMLPVIRLTTSRSAYRRAGLVIGTMASPTILTMADWEDLGHERQLVLLADDVVELASSEDEVTFKRLPADVRAQAIEAINEFMTGTGEEGGADSQTPLEPSLAPDAAAATGDDAPKTGTDAAAAAPEGKQPAADPAPASVAAPASPADEGVTAPSPSAGKPSGRASKAAKPKTSEAKAAS